MVHNQIWKVVVGSRRDAASKERRQVFLTSWGHFRFHQPMLERHRKEKKKDPLLPMPISTYISISISIPISISIVIVFLSIITIFIQPSLPIQGPPGPTPIFIRMCEQPQQQFFSAPVGITVAICIVYITFIPAPESGYSKSERLFVQLL